MDSNKRPVLFGTPLSKVLDNEANNDDDRAGPINRRRVRTERQQIVTDDQGRRRFHGAFTGGFSAGHYNSVGTSQGFQPKSFVSRRGERQDNDDRSAYGHRPEDYMDDEDFGEFGIAPKKVRLAGEYSKSFEPRGALGAGAFVLKPKQESIGAKILRSMVGGRIGITDENDIDDITSSRKNDLHGLGYKPLNRPEATTTTKDHCQSNPLVATLKQGQRLEISGEAFGSGVLDDDDDDVANLPHADEYGIDTMANYNFGPKTTSKQQCIPSENQPDSTNYEDNMDEYAMDDFILARDVESLDICGDSETQYPRPVICANWKMPVRDEPYVPPLDATVIQAIRSIRSRVDKFSEKFTGSSSAVTKCDYMEGPSGLLKYSDLKTHQRPTEQRKSELDLATATASDQGKTMIRRVVEWRPCSLLCRHFDVPNPYPDNAFCGVRPDELSADLGAKTSAQLESSGSGHSDGPAPMELRRSIFNIGCEETTQDADDEDETDDDEQPQVIELNSDHEIKCHMDRIEDKDSDKESDVVVMLPEKKEPEVIDLLSSSSADESNDDDEDAYGPPLPPSRRTLEALDRPSVLVRASSLSSTAGVSDSKKKSKKRKSKKKRR